MVLRQGRYRPRSNPHSDSLRWAEESVRLRGSLPIVDNESGNFLCIAKTRSAKMHLKSTPGRHCGAS